MPATIALIAHDRKKDDLINFVQQHKPVLARYKLISTATTGGRIQNATGLTVELKLSGAMGGDVQIASDVAALKVAAVIFLIDPISTQPQEPDIATLFRICNLHNIPLATNLATADAIIHRLAKTLVAHLIFNPVAGQGNAEQELTLIRDLLEPHLHLEVHETTPEIDLGELVQEAIAANADLILASGGDGTVSAVAGALISTGIPLGIIPRGTANAFAVALGIPQFLPIRNACQVILAGNTRNVDAALCNNLPMILLAGVGYEAVTIELANRELKNQWGVLAYLMAGWQAAEGQTLFETEIEVEGQVHKFEANALTVANAAPATSVLAQGGGQVIFDDGLLDVTIATAENRLQGITTMLGMLGAAISGSNVQQQNVIHGRTKRLKVTTNPPQKVVVDGEVIGTTPIELECIPGGLTVLVPKA